MIKTVGELIDRLSRFEPDAPVRILAEKETHSVHRIRVLGDRVVLMRDESDEQR